MLQDLNNHGFLPPISFKPEPDIWNKPDEKQESLKVGIKTYTVDINSETVLIYLLIFNIGLAKALLKFIVLLKKIFRGRNLTMGRQFYVMKKNLLAVEALQVFKQRSRSIVNKTTTK